MKQLCVLLIEDNEIILALVPIWLEHYLKNVSVKICRDIEEVRMALRKKGHNFDLVILDKNLPNPDRGFEILRELRGCEQYHTTPILLYTDMGEMQIEKLQREHEDPHLYFCPKSIPGQPGSYTLTSKIRALVESKVINRP